MLCEGSITGILGPGVEGLAIALPDLLPRESPPLVKGFFCRRNFLGKMAKENARDVLIYAALPNLIKPDHV